jgi:peroxiredoxin
MSRHDLDALPADLPVPADDGAADHLRGRAMPALALPATGGGAVRVDRPGDQPRAVIYVYPRTGVPGQAPLTPDWDLIPGARGCTPEACAFADHHAALARAGASVHGLSTQTRDYQREVVKRLHLPFELLSDADLRLTRALALPTFQAAGQTLLRRLTLVIADGAIEHVFHPVFPPDRHAEEVLAWLRAHRAG